MSHWRCWATEGAEFWVSCNWPAFLSNFSCLQLIQKSAPSNARGRQCDIRIIYESTQINLFSRLLEWSRVKFKYGSALDNFLYSILGVEGKAGMISLYDPEEEIDLAQLAEGIKKQLPSFAWPLFVRFVKHLDITGTFKLRKFNLQKEGFDPSIISDKLFFLHPKTGKYEILNVERFTSIINGNIRLWKLIKSSKRFVFSEVWKTWIMWNTYHVVFS